MHWIDYSIFVIVFFAAVMGLASGPLFQFIRIGCLFISFLTALLFHNTLGNFLQGFFTQSTAGLFGYLFIYGVAFIATHILTDVIKKIIGKWEIGIGMRLLGGLLGIIKGLVFSGVIIYGVLTFCSKATCDTVYSSKVATHIGKGMQKLVSGIPENISEKINNYANDVKKKNPPKGSARDKSNDFKSPL